MKFKARIKLNHNIDHIHTVTKCQYDNEMFD